MHQPMPTGLRFLKSQGDWKQTDLPASLPHGEKWVLFKLVIGVCVLVSQQEVGGISSATLEAAGL